MFFFCRAFARASIERWRGEILIRLPLGIDWLGGQAVLDGVMIGSFPPSNDSHRVVEILRRVGTLNRCLPGEKEKEGKKVR